MSNVSGYVAARNGKWHRAVVAEPTFMRDEATSCGLTFRPLNVTWNGKLPPTTRAYMCQRPGCAVETCTDDDMFGPDSAPGRWQADEIALFRAGRCSWQTSYGTGLGDTWCGKPSKPGASFGFCPEHSAELLEGHYRDGTPRPA
jgi:hypothetical protein